MDIRYFDILMENNYELFDLVMVYACIDAGSGYRIFGVYRDLEVEISVHKIYSHGKVREGIDFMETPKPMSYESFIQLIDELSPYIRVIKSVDVEICKLEASYKNILKDYYYMVSRKYKDKRIKVYLSYDDEKTIKMGFQLRWFKRDELKQMLRKIKDIEDGFYKERAIDLI